MLTNLRFWLVPHDRLFEPTTVMNRIHLRRQAQLLSSLLLALIPFMVIGAVVLTIIGSEISPLLWCNAIVFAVAYVLNRTRWHTISAPLGVLAISVSSFVALLTKADYSPAAFMVAFVWIGLALVFGQVFLPIRGLLILAAGNVLGLFLFALLIPQITLLAILEPVGFILSLTALLFVAAHHRNSTEAEKLMELATQNQELDAFSHTVAHDLKEPLATITLLSDHLRTNYGRLPEEKRIEIASRVVDTSVSMARIIDNLLLLATVRKEAIQTKPLDMGAILDEVQKRLEYTIHQYQAEVILPETWPKSNGHGPWIEEVWVNYLVNGLKYGGQPPRLELGAKSQQNGMVRFWVRDNGSGLTTNEKAKIFVPFTRINQVHTNGQGLGLSIVQRIIEKLGGQVGVESQPGEGSTFWFELPFA